MNRIKELRNEKNINQETIGKLLGLEIAGVSKLETGRVPLKDEYIVKLAEYFGVSTDYLLCKSDIRNPETVDFDPDKLYIGLSAKDYNMTDEKRKQIEDFAKFVLADNKKDKEDKKEK